MATGLEAALNGLWAASGLGPHPAAAGAGASASQIETNSELAALDVADHLREACSSAKDRGRLGIDQWAGGQTAAAHGAGAVGSHLPADCRTAQQNNNCAVPPQQLTRSRAPSSPPPPTPCPTPPCSQCRKCPLPHARAQHPGVGPRRWRERCGWLGLGPVGLANRHLPPNPALTASPHPGDGGPLLPGHVHKGQGRRAGHAARLCGAHGEPGRALSCRNQGSPFMPGPANSLRLTSCPPPPLHSRSLQEACLIMFGQKAAKLKVASLQPLLEVGRIVQCSLCCKCTSPSPWPHPLLSSTDPQLQGNLPGLPGRLAARRHCSRARRRAWHRKAHHKVGCVYNETGVLCARRQSHPDPVTTHRFLDYLYIAMNKVGDSTGWRDGKTMLIKCAITHTLAHAPTHPDSQNAPHAHARPHG